MIASYPSSPASHRPSIADVCEAARRLRGVARRTPVLHDTAVLVPGAEVFVKCENLQVTGAFKFRGMYNRLATLDPQARELGVVTASAGNAGLGLAAAAQLHGVPCTVVMLAGAVSRKLGMVRGAGAEVAITDGDAGDLLEEAQRLSSERDLTFVHPFDDSAVIAGQGTAGLELTQQVGELDDVLVPTAGGGLLAGCGIALKNLMPGVRLIGVEAAGAAKLEESLRVGHPVEPGAVDTIADGLAYGSYGALNFDVVRDVVDELVVVSDEEILEAMATLWLELRLAVEPAGAAAVAAARKIERTLNGRRAGIFLSGGNVELEMLEHALTRVAGQRAVTGD